MTDSDDRRQRRWMEREEGGGVGEGGKPAANRTQRRQEKSKALFFSFNWIPTYYFHDRRSKSASQQRWVWIMLENELKKHVNVPFIYVKKESLYQLLVKIEILRYWEERDDQEKKKNTVEMRIFTFFPAYQISSPIAKFKAKEQRKIEDNRSRRNFNHRLKWNEIHWTVSNDN